jgi:hypothetical protein
MFMSCINQKQAVFKNCVSVWQGDQIGWFFANWATLMVIFWKDEVAQRNANILVMFCSRKFLHFHLIEQFQNMVCCRDFEVSKGDWCRYFGLSSRILMQVFWQLFWLLSKYFGKIFQIFWSPWCKGTCKVHQCKVYL